MSELKTTAEQRQSYRDSDGDHLNRRATLELLDDIDTLLARASSPDPASASNEQIKHMADRFLGWRLPEHFNPDCGISFKKDFNENAPWPWPVGTNLFSAMQAEEMVRNMVKDLPARPDPAREALVGALRAENERLKVDNAIVQRALENTVETLNDLADDVSSSRSYSRSYHAFDQIKTATIQIEARICNHDIRWPHECKDCLDILSSEMREEQRTAALAEQGHKGATDV